MTGALLTIAGLRKRFGGVTAVDGVDLTVEAGECHAVIGPNGAGKTTLVSMLSGDPRPDSGRVSFAGRDITGLPPHARARLGLARSFQITSVIPSMSALENALLAVQARAGHAFRFWRPARQDPVLLEPARAALRRVGLPEEAGPPAAALSHGELRQLEIAMALATEPALLLLDEPMAGTGTQEAARMVAMLQRLKGDRAMLLIEHDMDVVFALADRITVLVYGRVIASGPPGEIRADPAVRRAYLGDESS